MAKSLSSLWLTSLRRGMKVQRAQSRLLKSLMPKAPRAKRAKAVKAVQSIRPAKARQPVKRVTAAKRASARSPASAAPVAGSWQKLYFSAPGPTPTAATRRMLYWLYLPAKASEAAGAPLPLVVMLHGCQQTATDLATSTRMNQLAERKGFAVLYPQQSAASDAHRCWHWYQRAVQHGQGEVRLIADMIAQVQQRHGLDTSRTYVAGISAGAALAAIVALRHPALIAAVGLHSAPVFGTADSALSAYRAMQGGAARSYREVASAWAGAAPQFPGMPALLIHGDRDPVVRRINAGQLAQQFAIVNGSHITSAAPTRRSYPGRAGGRSPRHAYTTVTHYAGRKPQLVQCDIAALGHAWSGGDDSVSFSARAGPSATLMMWTFFARHRRDAAG
jgi:poly(hydroxyalkanoate) depolymerase family esterase